MARRQEPKMSTESMEYIVTQIRKLRDGEIPMENNIDYKDLVVYNFEDVVDGGLVSISYYHSTNGFNGHHHGYSKPFSGYIFNGTARIDVDGISIDIYA